MIAISVCIDLMCYIVFVEMMSIMCLLCRDFIDGNYVDLNRSNPKLPILIREWSGVRPVMFARYGE